MKSFWKKMCVCSLALVSPFAMIGCGETEAKLPVDLDGDGVVSSWENFFAEEKGTKRADGKTVVEINTVDELLAINDSEETEKFYLIKRNIDCGGKEVSVNLKKSTIYGNNKILTNFKLGNQMITAENDETAVNAVHKCLFYNAAGVYDLNLFVGKQDVAIDNIASLNTVAPLVDCGDIDNVSVKGYINVTRKQVSDLKQNTLQVSLLGAVGDQSRIMSVANVDVEGKLDCIEETDTQVTTSVGSVLSMVSPNSVLYNARVNVDMSTYSTHNSTIGMIAGENKGMISTCHSSGNLTSKYLTSGNVMVGGIVGKSYKLAEVRNVSTDSNITISNDTVNSKSQYIFVGGVIGFNEGGIVEYANTDAKITTNDTKFLTIGGLCGVSENGIFSNIISRGSVTCNNASTLNIANLIGVARNGQIDTAAITTNIVVNNSQIDSIVNAGMVTIFEDFISCKAEDNFDTGLREEGEYTAIYSPNFKGLLISGTTDINMKPSNNNNRFEYNLGLRNNYKYKTDEMENVDIEDENGDIVTIEVPVYKTLVPDVFENLYFVTEDYKFNKKAGEDVEVLEITYPKNASNQDRIISRSKSYNADWLGRYIGFKYGLNNSEVDLNDVALDKIRFTLSKDKHLIGKFAKLYYNNELTDYDHQILKACTFDIKDEMFSLLNSAIVSGVDQHIQVIMGKDFLNSFHPSDIIQDLPEEDVEPEEGEDVETPIEPVNLDNNSNNSIVSNAIYESSGEGDQDEEFDPGIVDDVTYLMLESDSSCITKPILNIKNNFIRLFDLMNLPKESYDWCDDKGKPLTDFMMPYYLVLRFSDENKSYEFKIDLSPLRDVTLGGEEGTLVLEEKLIMNMYLTVKSHTV